MKQGWLSYTRLIFVTAAILFGAVGVSSLVSIRRQGADAKWVEHTHEVLEQLETTLRFATDARRGAAAYVATGDLHRLQSCFDAQRQTEIAVTRAAAQISDNAKQLARAQQLQTILVEERAGFDAVVSARSRDVSAAIAMLQAPEWTGRFARLRGLIDAMKADEQRLLVIRSKEEDASVRRAQLIVIGGEILAFALVMGAFIISGREALQRRGAEARLASANRELTDRVADLQQRSSELALLSRLGQLLQSCETQDESGAIIRSVFPRLFPGTRGAVYVIAASRNLVAPVTAWPHGEPDPERFQPSDCWALRGGTLHRTFPGGVSVACKHTEDESQLSAVCIPLMAHGEALGLLHIRFPASGQESIEVAATAAEQLSLAMANLAMQETLRRQAMRDPLTGLFNRRYMEETLEREIHRAARQRSMIGVLLLDLDHFKEYNDTLGHFAGDDLLRSVAGIMQRVVRAEDVVCRYGGDEFVIIMPEATAAVVEQRAHDLHDGLSRLPGPDSAAASAVTVSIGIALYPTDASAGKDLLLAADSALYQAKRAGRARIARASRATSPSGAASVP